MFRFRTGLYEEDMFYEENVFEDSKLREDDSVEHDHTMFPDFWVARDDKCCGESDAIQALQKTNKLKINFQEYAAHVTMYTTRSLNGKTRHH